MLLTAGGCVGDTVNTERDINHIKGIADMDPKLKAAIAAKKARNAKMLDPLRIAMRAEVKTDKGEVYYINTCLAAINEKHRDAFRNGEEVPYAQQADGTKRTICMV